MSQSMSMDSDARTISARVFDQRVFEGLNMQTQESAASASHAVPGEIHALLREQAPDARRIGELLDALSQADRIAAVRSLGGREQARLWRAVDGARPLRLTDLV